MNYLQIEANDTLFFRDGKPFSMGDESFAEAIFPPAPSVLYGLLRSVWFSQNMNQFSPDPNGALAQRNDESLKLQIGYISLTLNNEALLPFPNDLLRTGESAAYLRLVQNPIPASSYASSGLTHILESSIESKVDELAGKAYLRLTDFNQYLAGSADASALCTKVIELKDIVKGEPKVGLARVLETRTSKDGHLFSVSQIRPKTQENGAVDFLIGCNDLNPAILPPALARIGADGKTAAVITAGAPGINPTTINGDFLKMYLATPAVFKNGWQPDIDLNCYGVKIIAASIGRVQHIGGFDMVHRRPKPMLKAIPAGSVYFLQVEDDTKRDLLLRLHGQSICGSINGYDYHKEGFGIVYFANCHSTQRL
jgi:CRISPR-associated protein Cmr3